MIRTIPKFALASALALLAAAAPAGENRAARRLTAPGEGIVRVSGGELAAWGLSSRGRRLYVYTDGRGLDYVPTAGGGLEFYAAPYRSLYARERAFLVSNRPLPAQGASGPAQPAAGTSGKGKCAAAPEAYTAVCHLEEDQLYLGGLPNAAAGEDHWLYSAALVPGAKMAVTAVLDGPLASGKARVTVALRGGSNAPGFAPDHRVAVSLNGQKLGEALWDGDVRHEAVFEAPAGLAAAGANAVEVSSLGLPGVTFDFVLVDWVEVAYPRVPEAVGDRLSFGLETAARQTVVVGGFSGPGVAGFDVTDPARPRRLELTVKKHGPAWRAEWLEPHAGRHHYALAGPGGVLAAGDGRAADPWSARSGRNWKYLVVSHADYLPAAERLAALHGARGLKAGALDAAAVYDAFGCGQAVPEAIRALCAFHRPDYLCLVGDASADARGLLGAPGCGLVPSYFAQDRAFEGPSDNLFGCLDAADELPETAVGRLPARSLAEAQAMVDKSAARLAWDSSSEPPQVAALLVGDNDQTIYPAGTEEFAAFFDWGPVEKVLFSAYGGSAPAIRAAILAGWAKGPRCFIYFGHGASSSLGKGKVLRDADAPKLIAPDGRLPSGAVLACLAGYFNFTSGADSLAERLLKEPGKGVCALVAPAGMCAPEGQRALGRELAREMAAGKPLGRALTAAKRRLPACHADVLRSFNLLGDPALE